MSTGVDLGRIVESTNVHCLRRLVMKRQDHGTLFSMAHHVLEHGKLLRIDDYNMIIGVEFQDVIKWSCSKAGT